MFLPSIGEAANGFTETYGKFGDSFQALDGAGRQAVAPGKKQFGIAEYSG